MMFPEINAFINSDARKWSVDTYRAAKQLIMTMRISGVDEPDRDLRALARQIDRYDRNAFNVSAR